MTSLFYAQLRFRRRRRSGRDDPCKPPWWSGRRDPNFNVGPQSYKVLSLARLGALCRAQNSLFASVISFKGIRTQFSLDRSVATGELWEMWRCFQLLRGCTQTVTHTFKFLCVYCSLMRRLERFNMSCQTHPKPWGAAGVMQDFLLLLSYEKK